MEQSEFEILIADSTKKIVNDISWSEDEDHSPTVRFRAEVASDAVYPIFVRGSYNAAALTLTYALIHRGLEALEFISLFDDTLDIWLPEDVKLVSDLSEVAHWSKPDELAAKRHSPAPRRAWTSSST